MAIPAKKLAQFAVLSVKFWLEFQPWLTTDDCPKEQRFPALFALLPATEPLPPRTPAVGIQSGL